MASADLKRLERDLQRAEDNAGNEAKKVVKKGALNIKKHWANLAAAYEDQGTAKRFDRSISFDELGGAGTYSAEIGPDKGRRQGALGNLVEFGSKNNAETRMGEVALALEEPRFIAALQNVGLDLLK